MSQYGKAAVAATKMCKDNPELSPYDAWVYAISKETKSSESIKKP